jgi:hypothetical protein
MFLDAFTIKKPALLVDFNVLFRQLQCFVSSTHFQVLSDNRIRTSNLSSQYGRR